MTIEQTYQLGVEFERRLIEIDPAFETTSKLDTETIYKFLNQYAQQYVQDLILQLERVKDNPTVSATIADNLKSLIKTALCNYIDSDNKNFGEPNSNIVVLPEDYYMYIRSTSECRRTYKDPKGSGAPIPSPNDIKILSNKVVREDQVNDILETCVNNGGILRNPIVVLNPITYYNVNDSSVINQYKDRSVHLITDKYTEVKKIWLWYYALPGEFSILENPEKPCELPYSCFWDLVKGAVDLYMYSYKYGVTLESLKRRAAQRAQDERDVRRIQKQGDDEQ